MSARTIALLLSVACAGASVGCTFSTFENPGTFSTKNLPGLSTPPPNAPIVSGESCDRLILLIIPAGFGQAETAFEEALSKAPGTDTLVNWRLEHDFVFVAPFYIQACVRVKGQAVASNQLMARAEDPGAARAFVDYWGEQRTAARTAQQDLEPQRQAIPK